MRPQSPAILPLPPRRPPDGVVRLIVVILACLPAAAVAASLRLELGRLLHPAFAVHGVKLAVDDAGGPAELRIDRVELGGHAWRGLRVACPAFRFADGALRCAGGTLALPGAVERGAIDLRFDLRDRSGTLALRLGDGERVAVALRRDGRVELDVTGFELSRLAGAFPELAAWRPAGKLDGRGRYAPGSRSASVRFGGKVRAAGFATADGLRAAEGIAAEVELRATRAASGWDWNGRLAWTGGETYWHPVYVAAGPTVEAAGRFDRGVLAVTQAELRLDGVRTIAATGEYDVDRRRLRRAALAVADADLAVVGPRFLAPALAPANAEQWRFAGRVSAGMRIEDGELSALDVAFDEAGFSLADEALSFGPLNGALPWLADSATRGRLEVAGGRWQKLVLGPFALDARLEGPRVDVRRVAIPLLDGAVVVEDLALRRDAAGWSGRGAMTVEPVSMKLLTEAVGWPSMSGVLSASLPGLHVAPGRVALDGALVISVFGGYLQATRLQLLEPFGVASRLEADIDARHLDLAQLTETFSFGSITGFVDAEVGGLELARWRPVRFDARIASSPGRYPRRISQRAVQNISALGGAGAGAALQRGLIGLFDTFGYSEIGVSCRLRGEVCTMGGLGEAAGGGFYLVRGGGVPAINVIGYNRRVDWRELIDRLQQAIASNAAPVIR